FLDSCQPFQTPATMSHPFEAGRYTLPPASKDPLMKIGLKDLHPSVCDVLAARVWNLRGHSPEDVGVNKVIGRRWKGWGWRVLAAVPIGAAVGAGIVAFFGGPHEAMAGMGFIFAYLYGMGTGFGYMLLRRQV